MADGKEFLAREVGLDANSQDDRDMERLGKAQQFKVGREWLNAGGWRFGLTRYSETSDFIRFLDLRRR
jgi:hypothetical protein